jgi:hypothetical protein
MAWLATALAGLALAGAAPDQAPVQTPATGPSTAFRLFKDVCLDSDGSRRLEVEAAQRNAFALGNGGRRQEIGGLTNAFMLGWTGDNMRTGLILGEKGPLQSCVVTSPASAQADLVREVEAWAGFRADPRHVDGTVTNFYFAQTDQGRVPQWDATLELQRDLFANGTLRVVWVNVTREGVTLSFTAPPKADAAP